MSRVPIDPFRPEPEILAKAADILRRGGIVAFPTETVYGLGANALDEAAVRRVFAVKGRPGYNPLIVHVADPATARRWAREWSDVAERLAAAHWPGPLTLVVWKRAEIPDIVTAGLPTVGLRVPDHPVALALLRAADLPLAAPSANRFTRLSPTTAEHVDRGIGDAVDLILDAGPTSVGIESTVVDLSGARPTLLRPGAIGAAELERVTGRLASPATYGATEPRAAPGMVVRHYAPRAELRVFDAAGRGGAAELARSATAAGRAVGALLLRPLDAPLRHVLPMPDRPERYAQQLYAALHSLDDLGCDMVLVEDPPPEPDWEAVRDRLRRASG